MTLWTVAGQAPLSMGFSRQEILEWVAISPPGDFPAEGSNLSLMSPLWRVGSLPLALPGKSIIYNNVYYISHVVHHIPTTYLSYSLYLFTTFTQSLLSLPLPLVAADLISFSLILFVFEA